jgi:sortase (surface protein transpeptidase)
MPNPDGPDDVAYYDFSAWPGKGGRPGAGNPVFAGHVDSGHQPCDYGTVPPPCTAVLWDLNNLALGDEIQIVVDGTLYKYSVTSNEPVHASSGPWDQIVSSTAQPTLTIITCGGDFNRETGEYDRRQVVKAELVGQEPAPS